MSLPVFLGYSPKLLCGVTMGCAAPAFQTRSRKRRCSQRRTGTRINTSRASALLFSTILPILEPKSKERGTPMASALPLLPRLFSKICVQTGHELRCSHSTNLSVTPTWPGAGLEVYEYSLDLSLSLLHNTSDSGIQKHRKQRAWLRLRSSFSVHLPKLWVITSWSAPVLFSKQCKKKRMFLALDCDVYKYPAESRSILLHNT